MNFNRFSFILLMFAWLVLLLDFNVKAQKTTKIHQLLQPAIMDGIPDTILWDGADKAGNFIQMEPFPGQASTENTVCHIGIFEQTFYAVFYCYQKTPVVAKNQSRDALSKNDDLVALILDTYNDKRSGYAFFANPLGTLIDMKINDDGRNTDLNWDSGWSCKTGTFDWGWFAEFEIPLESIKYNKKQGDWGINFGRIIRANSETAYWSGQLTDDFRLSQGGILTGFEVQKSKMQLTLLPYINLKSSTDSKLKVDGGTDINWQIGSNVSVNATINPDFATVEADKQQINLTRYELSYPEKRVFFQEGNEMYNTRIKTFYSRRIQDIDYGARINGKIGKTQFNVLSVKSPEVLPDSTAAFFTAARVKHDFLKSSTVGFTLVSKDEPGYSTRSFSADYVMNLAKTWQLTGQFVASTPGSFWEHSAWYLRFARENNIYHYHIRYSQLGENFRDNVNQTGFITDDDRREIDSDVTYKWWLKNNTFDYIDFQSLNNIFWSISGKLRSWYITESVKFYMKNKISYSYAYNNEFKLYEKEYYNHKHIFNLGYNTDEWSHALAGYTFGRNFDRDISLVNAGAQIKPVRNLSLSYTANWVKFTPDEDGNSTFLNVLTLDYNFTKDLWLRVFAQSSSATDKFYIYGLFGWRFKPPFGAVYLIYSHDEFEGESNWEMTNDLFFKITFPLVLL